MFTHRSLLGLASTAGRALSMAQRTSNVALVRQRMCVPAAFVLARQPVAVSPSIRSFSMTTRACGEGADVTLAQKLEEELQYERESSAGGEAVPEFLSTFKQQGIWTIDGMSGQDMVKLERKFGNETVRVMFSIADLDALAETEYAEGEGGEGSQEPTTSPPIRVSIAVTKATTDGALAVDAVCQDGAFLIETVSFYPNASVGTDLTSEADWKRRGMYIGPPFETLDPDLQDQFESFLNERGIDQSLALFILDYASHKEEHEYVRWLEGLKDFVSK